MLIDGEFKMSQAKDHVDIVNPATQEKLSRVPICTQEELQAAAASCQEAFPAWRNTSVSNRVRVMLKWQQLIREHQSTLSVALRLWSIPVPWVTSRWVGTSQVCLPTWILMRFDSHSVFVAASPPSTFQ